MNPRFHDQRAAAARVPCPARPHGCGAEVGEHCRNLGTGSPLEHRPAHEARLAAAGIVLTPVDPAELRDRSRP